MISLIKASAKYILPEATWSKWRNRCWRYVRPLTVDYCPVGLPWFRSTEKDTPNARLHKLARSFHWNNQWSFVTAVSVVIATVLWPFRLCWDAFRAIREHGKEIKTQHGIGYGRQMHEILRHSLTFNTPPLFYYRYRFFDAGKASHASTYLYPEQMSILHPTLTVNLPSDAPLRRKDQFFAEGRKRGLPVVGVVSVFGMGEIQRWYEGTPDQLPGTDLIFKPVDDACGRGFQRWIYNKNRQTWRRGDCELDAAEFLTRCCQASQSHWHVLQKRLKNHRALSGLCSQGLSTVRVVTYRTPGGSSGVLLACLRMPTGTSPVDNFEAGGIAAPIDLQTGMLGAAVAKNPCKSTFTRHPDSEAVIEGFVVPMFSETIETTLAAHACFPWVPFVGWDVVITNDGPLLLEANPDWCVELAQIVTGTPLGETLYPEIYLEHLEAQSNQRAGLTMEKPAERVHTSSLLS